MFCFALRTIDGLMWPSSRVNFLWGELLKLMCVFDEQNFFMAKDGKEKKRDE